MLRCSEDGNDGVCVALTHLSRELIDASASFGGGGTAADGAGPASSGGCDSSDCLFCQYRSNSPFHLNAYAGKLTTLLRKRSLNGAALASLNSVLDASTEHGAALLAAVGGAAAVATSSGAGGGGKRQRSSQSETLAAAAPPMQPAASSSISGRAAASGHSALPYSAPSHLQPEDAWHDCGVMCEGGCEEHETMAGSKGSARFAQTMAVRLTALATSAATTSAVVMASVAGISGTEANAATSVSGACPVPSSFRFPSSHQQHNKLQQQHRGSATSVAAPQVQPHKQQHHQQQQQQPQPAPQVFSQRPMTGQALPVGWAFRPEWRGRHDPAPATLQEVMRLPGSSSSSSALTGSGRAGAVGGSGRRSSHLGGACSAGAGIVCALEFSPDGRLLAAGGVDKQIRLYNLSEALEDKIEDDEDEADESERLDAQAAGDNYRSGSAGTRGTGGYDAGDDDYDDDGERRRHRLSCRARGPADDDDDGGLLAAVQRMPSKISSISWSPWMDGVMTVGDYDGVLLQLHIASGHQLADVDAHGGRKIWSVAHSSRTPHLAASAADDRCARLWAGRGLATCVASLQPNPRASVCCVDFSPESDHLLALACSDRVSYLYDMRRLGDGPLAALRHHARPASYCRFLGGDRLVTAATDASLALWDLRDAAPTLAAFMAPPTPMPPPSPPAAAALASPFRIVQTYQGCVSDDGQQRQYRQLDRTKVDDLEDCSGSSSPYRSPSSPLQPAWPTNGHASTAQVGAATTPGEGVASCTEPARVFRGHRNEKNFVGLSVRWPDGLVACGSECSRAFAYHTSWSDPLATLDLSAPSMAGFPCPEQQPQQPQYPVCYNSVRRDSTLGGSGGFVSAVCWQPAEAAAVLGLPPLLASATSYGTISLSVLAARLGGRT